MLADGRAAGVLRFAGEPEDEAALTLSAVEGAMITAWPLSAAGDERGMERAAERFEAVTGRLLQGLSV